MFTEKLALYKKVGRCYKLMQQHEAALYYFKKQLHLAWYASV